MRLEVTIAGALILAVTLSHAWPWEKKNTTVAIADGLGEASKLQITNPLSVDEIKTLTLTKANPGQPGTFGLILANVKQSLLVASVAPDSLAAKAGLKFGDQILTVNDVAPMGRQLSRVHEWISSLDTLVLTYKLAPYNKLIKLIRKSSEQNFGFEVDEEAEIEMVHAETAAVRAGLMTDHVVLSVNGAPTGGAGRIVENLVPRVTGPELVLEVMPSNFYFPIMKSIDLETGPADDGESFVRQGNGHASGSILGSELINIKIKEPDEIDRADHHLGDDDDDDDHYVTNNYDYGDE